MGVLTWSPLAFGFLSGIPQGRTRYGTGRAALQPGRFDPRSPRTPRQYQAVEELISSPTTWDAPSRDWRSRWAHPGVTSVIIGPRTMEQLEQLLAGAGLALDDQTLDRMDEIVAPGSNHYPTEWRAPELR